MNKFHEKRTYQMGIVNGNAVHVLLRQIRKSGWTQFANHAKFHAGWNDKVQAVLTGSGPLDDALCLEHVSLVVDDLPFSFVERENSRRYSNLEDITRTTLMKYLEEIDEAVANIIKKEEMLPSIFGLIVDRWSCFVGEHYFAEFAAVESKI